MTSAAAQDARLRIVFVALDRDESGNAFGLQSIYTADGDGTNMRRITAPGDVYYDWAMWAMNGNKIVFTARAGGEEGVREPIYMMDPDGSNIVQLTANNWRNAQPKMTPDGHSIIFTSTWDEFPRVAVFRLDLDTLLVSNLSARSITDVGSDSDPELSADGQHIVYVSNLSEEDRSDQPTQVYEMNIDGTGRQRVTHDAWYNTDPSLSPDGRYVAISSYRGQGRPAIENAQHQFRQLRLYDWRLAVHDLVTRDDHVLTGGVDCTNRGAANPCAPNEGPAWIPRWTPDGQHLGYLSIRSGNRSGLYMMGTDGSGAHPVIETADKSITWFDWAELGPLPVDAISAIGRAQPVSTLLYLAKVFSYGDDPNQAETQVFGSTPDRWLALPIKPERTDITPESVRWAPGKQKILFTAMLPPARLDQSSAPPTQPRVEHFPADFGLGETDPAPLDTGLEQIFAMDSGGSGVRQLTTGRTEDPLDALPDGELRGNTSPDMSPDGRYLVFTNLSRTTGESWILRQNINTGAVLNLTSLTRGPLSPGADAAPRYSPDGSRIAFTSFDGDTSEIFVMDGDGYGVRELTHDDYLNVDPAWSPDGRWLVYSSYRGAVSPLLDPDPAQPGTPRVRLQDWYLIKLDTVTGQQVQLTFNGEQPALRPVWAPEGNLVAYLSFGKSGQPDIYVVGADGRDAHPLQITLKTKESSFDWR